MALDGIPFDLPHPFRDVYVLDETGQFNLNLTLLFGEELLSQSKGLVVSRLSSDRRVLRTSRRVVRT